MKAGPEQEAPAETPAFWHSEPKNDTGGTKPLCRVEPGIKYLLDLIPSVFPVLSGPQRWERPSTGLHGHRTMERSCEHTVLAPWILILLYAASDSWS